MLHRLASFRTVVRLLALGATLLCVAQGLGSVSAAEPGDDTAARPTERDDADAAAPVSVGRMPRGVPPLRPEGLPDAGDAWPVGQRDDLDAREFVGPHEGPPVSRVYVPAGPKQVSPGAIVRRGPFVSVQVNVDEHGMNILGDAANEPSIAIDPTNPDRMVIGWRQFDTVDSDFRQAGFAYTDDGGKTWTVPGVLTHPCT